MHFRLKENEASYIIIKYKGRKGEEIRMKNRLKKASVFFLAAALSLGMGNTKVSAAENTVNVKLEVQYGQAEAREITDMVNEFRTGSEAWYWNEDDITKTVCSNLGTLTYDKTLEQAAMKRAAELALGYSHTRVNGENCFTAYAECGYSGRAYGENIAAGYNNVESVFVGWREDDEKNAGQGHRRNMLSSNFDAIGMGHVYVNGVHYWAMELGNVNAAGDSGIDGGQTVTVEIQNSAIKSLSAEKDTYQTAVGSSIDLPTVNAVAKSSDLWPEGEGVAVTVENPDWTVGDGSIASITGGKVLGNSVGSTTLTASVGSENVTVTIQVTAAGDNEGNDPGTGGDEGNNPGTGGDEDNNPGTGGDEDNNPGNSGNEDSNPGNSGSGSSSSKSSSGRSKEPETIIIPTTSMVGGVPSAAEGAYMATYVNGTIVVTDKTTIAENYSLANNEKPYAKFYDFDAKRSLLAKQTIDSAAASQNAVVGPILNIELGKMANGNYSLLPSDGSAIRLSVGIPGSFLEADKTYGIVCVRAGGAYTILKDLDRVADTITFETTGGAGVYALIKY